MTCDKQTDKLFSFFSYGHPYSRGNKNVLSNTDEDYNAVFLKLKKIQKLKKNFEKDGSGVEVSCNKSIKFNHFLKSCIYSEEETRADVPTLKTHFRYFFEKSSFRREGGAISRRKILNIHFTRVSNYDSNSVPSILFNDI